MTHAKNNRQYKDSVFVDLFSRDSSAKDNFIALYNALHGTSLSTDSTEIKPIHLEQVLYMNFYNDVSCLIDNKIIVLAEHQSTVNENMPLRFLEYVTRLYEQLQNPRERYMRKLVQIPLPEFYVFYNGTEDFPKEKTLRLSEAFKLKAETIPLELVVRVININHHKRSELLARCKPLEEYSAFIDIVRENLEKDRDNGFKKAIDECVKNNILKEYLQRKSREVMNMLLAEYDYATDIEVQREEALQQGMQQGMQQGIERGVEQGEYRRALEAAKKALDLGISPETVSKITGLTNEEILSL